MILFVILFIILTYSIYRYGADESSTKAHDKIRMPILIWSFKKQNRRKIENILDSVINISYFFLFLHHFYNQTVSMGYFTFGKCNGNNILCYIITTMNLNNSLFKGAVRTL